MSQCLTYAPTTSPLKHVSTHISPRVTHAPGVKKGFIKGEALRLLITNSSKTAFEENIKHFQLYLAERGYQEGLVQRTFSEVIFENRKQTLQQGPKTNKQNPAFYKAIQLSSTKRFKTNTHETLVFNRKTTTAHDQRNIIQRASTNSIQKGYVS